MARSKYKTAEDLYVEGIEVVLAPEIVMWVQALNPFEYAEAQGLSSAARSRFTLAMKEIGSDELTNFEAQVTELDRDTKVARLVEVELSEAIHKVMTEIESDPEWKEVTDLLNRAQELTEGTPEERELLAKKNKEYLEEVQRRLEDERGFLQERLEAEPDDVLDRKLREMYIEHVSAERAMAEFEVAQILCGARVCESAQPADGEDFDHSECDHSQRIYTSRDEVRSLPAQLYHKLREAFDDLNMHPLAPKGSGSPEASSESSPPPSEGEESPPSTPEETSVAALGTSASPSTTP